MPAPACNVHHGSPVTVGVMLPSLQQNPDFVLYRRSLDYVTGVHGTISPVGLFVHVC